MYQYRWITFANVGKPIAWRPKEEDGEEFPDFKKGPTIGEFSNQLAGDGWELVSHAVVQGLPSWSLIAAFRKRSD